MHDTQPRSPFQTSPQLEPHPPNQPPVVDDMSGPGCIAWGLLLVAVGAFSLMIVVVAGLAGYTSGQAVVDARATATVQGYLADQIDVRIPNDLMNGNVELLGIRIEALASMTPGVEALPGLIATATQFYTENLPTETPTATVTTQPASTATATLPPSPAATSDAPAEAPATGFSADLDALYTEASGLVASAQWEEAAELLDAIIALDPDYRRGDVRGLMSQAMNQWALQLLRSGELAEGVVVADRARLYGDTSDIDYERYIAGLYLNAQASIGVDYPTAIQRLSAVYAQAPNYLDVRQTLFNTYVEYGDVLLETTEPCSAFSQYQAALQIQPANDVQQKMDDLLEDCAAAAGQIAGTPSASIGTGGGSTSNPAAVGEDDATPEVAPVGEVAPLGER